MKLVAQVRAEPEQPHTLVNIITNFNTACNWLSQIAFKERIFHWLPLQRRAYYELRGRFGVKSAGAHVIIRKVAYAYKKRRKKPVKFKPLGAIPVFSHSFKRDNTVSLYGIRVPFKARPGIELSGKHQAVLIYRNKKFYLHQIVEVAEPPSYRPEGVLGCDLGIVNLLVDSDGDVYKGDEIEKKRRIFAHRRRNLQKKKTRASKRKLRFLSGKQACFQRSINHWIAKKVVAKAKRHSLAIALEKLNGIRGRITVRKRQRARLSNWGFRQLQDFITYKARLAGVPIIFIAPNHTSQTCPVCGFQNKENRKSQVEFVCNQCGFTELADYVAALNIRARALGDVPMVAG